MDRHSGVRRVECSGYSSVLANVGVVSFRIIGIDLAVGGG
jgi:hypothetical protein